MNSTKTSPDDNDREEQIRRFFHEELHSNIKCKKNKWFPLGPEQNRKSYFEECQKVQMTKKDFEIPHYESWEQLRDVLRRFWEERGDHNIASHADGVARLAWELRDTKQDTGEVPAYIYVMF